MKIKICGITRLEDALTAVALGADLLGFNFYPRSTRYIAPAACAEIIHELQQQDAQVMSVGVFVNSPPGAIREIMRACELDLAQLCGDEPAAWLDALDGRAFKAIRPSSPAEAEIEAQIYARLTPPVLLVDAYQPGEYGGGGQTGDWAIAAQLAGQRPILLAGGLTPENVKAAVSQVQPWGVDVASGVESAPGLKDPAKMRAFVAAARGAIEEIHDN